MIHNDMKQPYHTVYLILCQDREGKRFVAKFSRHCYLSFEHIIVNSGGTPYKCWFKVDLRTIDGYEEDRECVWESSKEDVPPLEETKQYELLASAYGEEYIQRLKMHVALG